jgi:hypothetical protein
MRRSALLSDPGRDLHARPVAALRCCPRYFDHEGSPINHFEAQSHGFTTRCLRFVPPFQCASKPPDTVRGI